MNTLILRIRQALFSPIQKIQLYMQPKLLKGEHALMDVIPILVKLKPNRIMIVTTGGFIKRGTLQPFFEGLQKNKLTYMIEDRIKPDPEIADVACLADVYQKNECDTLIAIGGGSVLDCSKAALAAVYNSYTEISELLNTGKIKHSLPVWFAVPTTAGTGSEVTAGAVILDPGKKRKYALSHLFLIPKYAVLDASLLLSLPPSMTAYSGMDALTHAIEAYINCFNTKKTRQYALQAIKLIFDNLEESYHNGANIIARLHMLEASYDAGAAITNNYVGYVHAISHGIGGMYHLQHGYINAIALPIVLEEYDDRVVRKLARIAEYIGIKEDTEQLQAQAFIKEIKKMNRQLQIPVSIPEIRYQDIHCLAVGAYQEAFPVYPTPTIWDIKQLEKVIKRIKENRSM